jgi:UDP-N-acetylmuramate dehydrogenase
MCFGYRHTGMPADWIFVAAELKTANADPAAIADAMADIQAKREATQPVRTRTGGSTFANPTETSEARTKAWELIDQAGCRGLTRGGAAVSEKHCNFLVNTGNATAADIEDLGEEVRAAVFAKFGVELRWEIKRIGVRLEKAR